MRTLHAHAAGTEQSSSEWNRIAPGYDEFVTPSHMWLAQQGLQRAGLQAGMAFLDIAAGTGALAIPAARLGARVLATDQSPAMLALLDARARREGLDVETRAMDGHALALDDASFDVAASQFGVMLFPDMPQGVREMARVTKRGGRVLLHAYGDPARIEFLQFFVRAIQSVRPQFEGLPMDPPPLPLQLRDPARLRSELTSAGLDDVTVETVTETLQFPSGVLLWRWLVSSNPVVDTVLSGLELTADEEREVQSALDVLVRQRAGGGGLAQLTNPVHIGVGTRR